MINMKVILYMAMTANGMIARENEKTGWPQEEWNNYHEIVSKIGNIIIGRRTFEIMRDCKEFERIGNPLTIVVTNKSMPNMGKFIFVKSPLEAIKILEKKGFKKAIVAGGGKLNSS